MTAPAASATAAAPTAASPRIAIVAHAHPRLRAGGGEIAAWRQFDALRQAGADIWFLGMAPGRDGTRLGGGPGVLSAFDERDMILRTEAMSGFAMEQPDPDTENRLVAILARMDAALYHFHHVWNIGAGTLRRLRALRPQARMALTLHELASVCPFDGQMVRRSGALCLGWGPEDCADCLPGRTPLSVVIRRTRMLEVLNLMDVLIAPSRFLASRVEDWGIPPGRIHVIENGFPGAVVPATVEDPADLSRRFAFFGNATPTKGLGVLARAATLLAEDPPPVPPVIEMHGVDAEALARNAPGGVVPPLITAMGRYAPDQAVSLMQRQGWVIVPSTWWENAPVVIDEARAAGRVVIASNIGGMAEKTAGWGLQFPVGDAEALAALIARLSGDATYWQRRCAAVPPPVLLPQSLREWAAVCGVPLPPGLQEAAA